MKPLLNCLKDPCVHIVVLGLLLVQIAMSMGTNPDALDGATDAVACEHCEKNHQGHLYCSPPSIFGSGLTVID